MFKIVKAFKVKNIIKESDSKMESKIIELNSIIESNILFWEKANKILEKNRLEK